MNNMDILIKFHNDIGTGALEPNNEHFGLDYWIASNSIDTWPFESDYYEISGERLHEKVSSKRISPILSEINYMVYKSEEHSDGTIVNQLLNRMIKLIGVTDLWTLIEYAIERDDDCSNSKVSYQFPPWHHLVMDISNARIGMTVPTFVTIEPERTKWANKRNYTNRLFRSSMIGKGAQISLSMSDIRRNLDKANDDKLDSWRKVLSGARVLVNNDGLELDLKSFSSAEDFIEFQDVFTKVFMK